MKDRKAKPSKSLIVLPDIQPPSGDDALAREEDQHLTKRLWHDERRRTHDRKQRFADAIAHIATAFVYGGGFLLATAVLVWWWHLVFPLSWRWLEDSEISHLKDLLLSSALSAAVTLLAKFAIPAGPNGRK